MTTAFEVRSLLCGNTTRITAERKGDDAATIINANSFYYYFFNNCWIFDL